MGAEMCMKIRRSSAILQGLAVAGALAAFVLGGCATTEMAPVKTPSQNGSVFMGKDFALLTPGDPSKGQAAMQYFNPATDWVKYDKIIIEPVTFWGDAEENVSPSDQQTLVTYFRGTLEKQLSEKYEVVNVPGPDVMKLAVAVTDVEATNPELRTISLVVPELDALKTFQEMAINKYIAAGSLQAEMKLTDSMTGQTLAAALGRALGGGDVKAAMKWKWGDAEGAMDFFAKRTANNLYALTSGTATPAGLPLLDN